MNQEFAKEFDRLLMITSSEKSQRELSMFLSKHPKFVKYYHSFIEAIEAYSRAHYDKALQLYSELLKIFPDSATCNTAVGAVLYSKNNVDEALKYYEKALSINPKYEIANLNIAILLFPSMPEKAYEYFRKLIDINPKNSIAYHYAALIKFNSNDYTAAEYHLTEVLKIDKEYYEAIVLLADIYRITNRLEEAKTYYERSLVIKKNALVYLQLQLIAISQNKPDIALNYYNKAKEIDPTLKKFDETFRKELSTISAELFKSHDIDIFKKMGQQVGDVFITKLIINKIRHLNNIEIEISADSRKHLFITGRNGSGKTSLINALAKRIQEILDIPVEKFYTEAILQNKPPTEHPIFIHFNADGQLNFRLKYESGLFIVKHYDVRRLLDAKGVEKIEKVEIPKQSRIDNELANRMVAYLVDMDYIRLRAYRENNIETVEKLDKWFTNFIEILKTIDSDIETIKYTSENNLHNFRIVLKHLPNEFVDFSMLPDGFQAAFKIVFELILQMQSQIASTYDVDGVVIIDEPELYLHIEMQKKIMPILIQLFPQVQFIIATHSPYILNSVSNAVVYDLFTGKHISDVSNIAANSLVKHHFAVESEHSKIFEDKMNTFENYIKQSVNTTELTHNEQEEFALLETELDKASPQFSTEMYNRYSVLKQQIYG